MAIHAHSTPAPALPLLPFVFRPSSPAADPHSPDELLAEIAAEIERQEVSVQIEPKSELPPEPLSSADVPRGGPSDSPAQSRSADQIGNSDVVPNYPEMVGVVADLGAARTLHLRRQLAQAAEHGVALLAALGLPRLVTSGFVPLDRDVIGSALDLAIATLDAFDGDTDREDEGETEPSLGWTAHVNQTAFNVGGTTDAELDIADAEPSLASPERHPEVPDWCAPIRYLIDQSQASWAQGARDDREGADEDGPIDEDELDGAGEVDREPSIGWPEDFTAEVVPMLEASADCEHDDADLEDESDDDRGAEPWWSFERSAVSEVPHAG